MIGWIKRASAKADLILSVCTGTMLLAKVGLANGEAVTTHHEATDRTSLGRLVNFCGFRSPILIE